MMSGNMQVSMTIKANDQASAVLNRSKQAAVQAAEQAARASTTSQSKVQSAYRKTAEVYNRSVTEQTRLAQRAAQAREQLGIRSENAIQREIKATEDAYTRLARASSLSASEQARAYSAMTNKVKALRTEMNGVEQQQKRMRQNSGGSGLVGAAAIGTGAAISRDVMATNLRFERDLLEMKQTGEMSAAESLVARNKSMQVAGNQMQMPSDVLTGLRAFTSAGEKFDFAINSIEESARAATAYYSSAEVVAKLDVDAKQKLGIAPDQQKAMHNMLLYHGRAGRYEVGAMAQDAPKTFNTMANAGFTGIQAVNLTGALTQQLMKLAPATQPAEVATFMEHFFGHLTQKHYVKGLASKGINIKKYMPNGYFGGVDKSGKPIGGDAAVRDLMAFLRELKAKKLDDPFKLSEAGFRDMYTGKAAKQMLTNVDALESEMKNGANAADKDLVGQAVSEIKEANFGKIKAAEIEVEKMKLSETATKGTGWIAEHIPLLAAENPLSAGVVGGGMLASAGAAWKFFGRGGGGAAAAEDAAGPLAQRASSLASFAKMLGPMLAINSIATMGSDAENDEVLNGDAKWKKLRSQYSQQDIDAARQKYQPWYQFGSGYASENEQWLKQYKAQPAPTTQQDAERMLQYADKFNSAADKMILAADRLANPAPIDVRVQGGDIVAQMNQWHITRAGRG